MFVRHGIFQGAVFKFTIEIPVKYPNDRPEIIFESFSDHKLKHPFVDELLGFVDLTKLKKNGINDVIEYGWELITNVESLVKTNNYDSFANPIAAKIIFTNFQKYAREAELTVK